MKETLGVKIFHRTLEIILAKVLVSGIFLIKDLTFRGKPPSEEALKKLIDIEKRIERIEEALLRKNPLERPLEKSLE